jgi:Transposase IS116/IS110/IS902 family
MRLVAITSASNPSIAINAAQRAIRARITPCMARPPEPRRPPADGWFNSVHFWRRNRDGNEESTGRICDEAQRIAAKIAKLSRGCFAGLVPKQISTGDRTILGKISKRLNRYLRALFVHAAWVVLIKPKAWERHGLKPWIEGSQETGARNVLAIALANKLARIAWSELAGGRGFEANKLQAT